MSRFWRKNASGMDAPSDTNIAAPTSARVRIGETGSGERRVLGREVLAEGEARGDTEVERQVAQVVHEPREQLPVVLDDDLGEDQPEEHRRHDRVHDGSGGRQAGTANRGHEGLARGPGIHGKAPARTGMQDPDERQRSDRRGHERGCRDAGDIGQDEPHRSQGHEPGGDAVAEPDRQRSIVVVQVGRQRRARDRQQGQGGGGDHRITVLGPGWCGRGGLARRRSGRVRGDWSLRSARTLRRSSVVSVGTVLLPARSPGIAQKDQPVMTNGCGGRARDGPTGSVSPWAPPRRSPRRSCR